MLPSLITAWFDEKRLMVQLVRRVGRRAHSTQERRCDAVGGRSRPSASW